MRRLRRGLAGLQPASAATTAALKPSRTGLRQRH